MLEAETSESVKYVKHFNKNTSLYASAPLPKQANANMADADSSITTTLTEGSDLHDTAYYDSDDDNASLSPTLVHDTHHDDDDDHDDDLNEHHTHDITHDDDDHNNDDHNDNDHNDDDHDEELNLTNDNVPHVGVQYGEDTPVFSNTIQPSTAVNKPPQKG